MVRVILVDHCRENIKNRKIEMGYQFFQLLVAQVSLQLRIIKSKYLFSFVNRVISTENNERREKFSCRNIFKVTINNTCIVQRINLKLLFIGPDKFFMFTCYWEFKILLKCLQYIVFLHFPLFYLALEGSPHKNQ